MADPLADIDPRLCVQCKAARALCGINPCPLLERVKSHLPQTRITSKDISGSSPPTMFVGRYGYPKVRIGPMLSASHLDAAAAKQMDDPANWLDDLTIPDVVGMRSGLLRTAHAVRVDAAMEPDRITQVAQELAMVARPADTEVHLTRLPSFTAPKVGDFAAPHGPTVDVEQAALTENVRIEKPIQRAVDDHDALASDAIVEMASSGIDGYQLERVLSAGLLGQARNRKIVPTRWSITATDDILGKALAEKVLMHPTIDKPTVHFAEHFGNRFHVMLLPRIWGFELVEAWLKGAFWGGNEVIPAVDSEDHRGRREYASNTTGAYYAAKLAVLEHLDVHGRQATAIILREITDEYTAPLGVWVVRETMRRAMASKGLPFEDVASAVRHITRRARWKAWLPHADFFSHTQKQQTLDHLIR